MSCSYINIFSLFFTERGMLIISECEDILGLTHGYVNRTDGNNYLSEATYYCHMGFKVEGQTTVVCEANGVWNDSATCKTEGIHFNIKFSFFTNIFEQTKMISQLIGIIYWRLSKYIFTFMQLLFVFVAITCFLCALGWINFCSILSIHHYDYITTHILRFTSS